MNDGKADSPATADKSPKSDIKSYAERFAAQVEEWKKTGCPHKSRAADDSIVTCGAEPGMVRQTPATKDGKVSLLATCKEGHRDVFEFVVDVAEIKADALRNQDAARQAQAAPMPEGKRDPMVAEIRITMHLTSHEIRFDPWIPSPVVGLGMLEAAKKMIFDQIEQGAKERRDGLIVPEKKPLVGPSGAALN